MFVTTADQRAGILVAVITGGRPTLTQRPVRRFLPQVAPHVADAVWVVSDTDAPGYETDDHPLCVYPRAWAEEYATTHWMMPTPPEPGGFLGAFPGREWACQEAERRGCWGVLQLDDNIDSLGFMRYMTSGWTTAQNNGGLALFLDLLAAVALSTNARTVGAQLTSVSPSSRALGKVARPGFPYSLFIEKVGAGREEWFGPYEDDITHSLQYGDRNDGATSAVMPTLVYHKEITSRTGMRAHYNHERSVQLQRLFPQAAKVGVRATSSNGSGSARVFHTMPTGAIRNPLMVRDPALFGQARDRLTALITEWAANEQVAVRAKAQRRAVAARKATPKVTTTTAPLPAQAEIAETP